jgi:hypothetical protein
MAVANPTAPPPIIAKSNFVDVGAETAVAAGAVEFGVDDGLMGMMLAGRGPTQVGKMDA